MQVTFQLSVGCLVTHTYCILIEYGRDLEKDIVSETSGHFKQLLVSLLQVSHAKQDTLFAVDFEIRISKTIECLITCSQDKQSLTKCIFRQNVMRVAQLIKVKLKQMLRHFMM